MIDIDLEKFFEAAQPGALQAIAFQKNRRIIRATDARHCLYGIMSSLPKVPYLTFIDAFFLMSFAFSCACIVELVAVHQILERSRSDNAARVRTIARILYPVIYVAVLVVVALVFFETAANP